MKYYLLIDEKPESCETCPLRSYSNLELICTPMREGAYDIKCPLKPLPSKRPVSYDDEIFGTVTNLSNIVWNECIRELEK